MVQLNNMKPSPVLSPISPRLVGRESSIATAMQREQSPTMEMRAMGVHLPMHLLGGRNRFPKCHIPVWDQLVICVRDLLGSAGFGVASHCLRAAVDR